MPHDRRRPKGARGTPVGEVPALAYDPASPSPARPNIRAKAKISRSRGDAEMQVRIHFNTGIVFVRFIGTHADYDKIDATTA